MFDFKQIRHLLSVCYQCGTCVSTCAAGLVNPGKNIRRLVQDLADSGEEFIPKEDDLLWLCTTCYQCEDRCPEGVPLTTLLIQLKNMAVEKGAIPASIQKEIETLTAHGFTYPPIKGMVSRRCRLSLPELPRPDRDEMHTLITLTGSQHGPPVSKGAGGFKEQNPNISVSKESFALFPGCTVAYKLPHLEAAARYVMDSLAVHPVDLPFSCCPDPNGVQSYSSELWSTLAARNLALAEEHALDIVTLCNGCYTTLKHCQALLKGDESLQKRVNQRLDKIGRRFSGNNRVVHFYQLLYEHFGYERLQSLVVRPLDDLKIAVHYGCHCLRPKRMNPPENPENPQWLWQFVENVLGAQAVHYLDETLCCGAGLREIDQKNSLDLTRRKIRQMEDMGANAILVPCPTCYQQFDAGQRLLLRSDNREINGTSVFYQAELLAIAMGANPESIGIKFHLIKPALSLW